MVATGQTPNTHLLEGLQPSSPEGSLLNPQNGFIRVKPTMQFADPAFPHLYAVGDVADSGAHKAARPAGAQAAAAAKNIAAMIEGREPTEENVVGPAGIHLTLGLVRSPPGFSEGGWGASELTETNRRKIRSLGTRMSKKGERSLSSTSRTSKFSHLNEALI